jgi:hypothetical protein
MSHQFKNRRLAQLERSSDSSLEEKKSDLQLWGTISEISDSRLESSAK